MSLAIKQAKVYIKAVLLAALALAVALVLFYNQHNTVHVWFFGLIDAEHQVNVVWLMVCTAGISVASWWFVVRMLSIFRDAKEIAAQRQKQQLEREQREMAQKLADQERRIDAKLKQGVTEEPDTK